VCENPVRFLNRVFLLFEIVLEKEPLFVLFSDVVWRRCDDETGSAVWNLLEQIQSIAVEKCDLVFGRVLGAEQVRQIRHRLEAEIESQSDSTIKMIEVEAKTLF